MDDKNMYINTQVKRVHGSGVSPLGKIDFSYGINPYKMDFAALLNLDSLAINHYPDHNSTDFKKKVSSIYKVQKENIFVGNGSAEIIFLLFFLFVREKDYVSGLWPSYGDYQYYTHLSRAKFHSIQVNPPDFNFDPLKISREINKKKSKIFFFCNPANPTGKYYSKDILMVLLANINPSTLVVLDEAYLQFVEEKWNAIDLLNKYSNLLIMRSMTKDYGITAFRLGYIFGTSDVINALEVSAPSWHVNTVAQRAGVMALDNHDFLEKTTSLINKEKKRLMVALSKIGYTVLSSDINSFLLKVNNATEAAGILKQSGLLVRDCTSYDLPEYLRISVQKPSDNNKLVKVLRFLYEKLC